MRKFNLKTMLGALALLAFTSNAFAAGKEAAGQNGNAGGGIKRGNRYMTFYSAGFYTEAAERSLPDVPELNSTIEFFRNTALLSELTKINHIVALMPSGKRHYYKVSPEHFSQEVRARLIEEYARRTGANKNELVLFAITDTNNGNTYLLPEFDALNPIEKRAVLYHEAYWMLNPNSSYSNILNAEMTFQAYLEDLNSTTKLFNWLRASGNNFDLLNAAIAIDTANESLKGLLDKNKLYIHKIFGEQYINCMKQGLLDKCMPFILTNISALILRYPNSVFLKLLEKSYAENILAVSNKVDYMATQSEYCMAAKQNKSPVPERCSTAEYYQYEKHGYTVTRLQRGVNFLNYTSEQENFDFYNRSAGENSDGLSIAKARNVWSFANYDDENVACPYQIIEKRAYVDFEPTVIYQNSNSMQIKFDSIGWGKRRACLTYYNSLYLVIEKWK